MIVNGVWNVDSFPNHYVAEINGELKMFLVAPFRELKESDFSQYNGHHPRKMKGQPMASYLYRFYGLEKSEESLSEVVRVRITPSEKESLELYAKSIDKSVSEIIRDVIREMITLG